MREHLYEASVLSLYDNMHYQTQKAYERCLFQQAPLRDIMIA